MSELTNRINAFIAKTRVDEPKERQPGQAWMSEEEAAKAGIIKPTTKPEAPEPLPKVPKVAKIPKVHTKKIPNAKNVANPKTPKNPFKTSHYQVVPNGPLAEVAHQLTPKGPGYHSLEDIADDYHEARRLAGRIKNIGKPKIQSPEGGDQ